MKLKSKWKEVRGSGLAGALLTSLLGLICLVFPVGQGLVHLSYDLPFALRPNLHPQEVAIIYIDEDSHSALKQESLALVRWDRTLHAQLLTNLVTHYSVKAVVFDILFDEPTTTNWDNAFLEAVKLHGKVVLSAQFLPVTVGRFVSWATKKPFPELMKAAATNWGIVETPYTDDADEVIRRHYRMNPDLPGLVSLAWRTAELTRGKQALDASMPRWLNYYGPPLTIPWVSYVQVLSNTVPLAALSNKVVFVGAHIITGYAGGKGTDEFPTPYTRWTGAKSPGVEVNATAYLNLAQDDWLIRFSPLREFLLCIGVGLLFGFGLSCLRPAAVALCGVAGMLVIFAAACFLVWQHRVWVPWAIASVVQIPSAAVCALLFRAEKLSREKETLQERLAALAGSATVSPVVPGAGRSPVMAAPTPSVAMRQQLGELLHTPAPTDTPDQAPTMAAAGQVLLIPDCTLLRCIGSGAYGEVWIGMNVLGAYRAVKIVYRKHFKEDRPYEREFEGIRHFDPISRNHPGLVHILHVGRNDTGGYFYYLMELADDCSEIQPLDPAQYQPKTLGGELKRRGRFSLNECVQLGLALTDSVGYLHEHGLVHRDIKPSNIIFVNGQPKLADIGLVTQIGDGLTFVGTEGFFPPEGPGSPVADLYSLGKLLYESLTGLSRQQYPDLPTDIARTEGAARFQRFNKIILRACENNLGKRYASARQVHADLEHLAAKRTSLRLAFKSRAERHTDENKK